MCFLFRLDLSLHAGAKKKIGILNLVTKHGLVLISSPSAAAIDPWHIQVTTKQRIARQLAAAQGLLMMDWSHHDFNPAN